MPFSASDRHDVDYLTSEVLDGLDDKTRRFLLGTSIFDRFTATACDAVLCTDDSAGVSPAWRVQTPFLVVLDSRGAWYRYNHLFRDLRKAKEMVKSYTEHYGIGSARITLKKLTNLRPARFIPGRARPAKARDQPGHVHLTIRAGPSWAPAGPGRTARPDVPWWRPGSASRSGRTQEPGEVSRARIALATGVATLRGESWGNPSPVTACSGSSTALAASKAPAG